MECQNLRELCLSAGVNGYTGTTETAKRLLSGYTTDIRTDRIGNIIGFIPSSHSHAPTVLLEAHLDEIGFLVTGTDDKGFLRLSACGGIDDRTLSAAEVTILTEPPIPGVFCSTPPHLMKKEEPLPSSFERGVDAGLTGKDAAARVPLGTRVVFCPHFEQLLGDRVCGKSLDNRAGMAAILHALELVKGQDLPCHVAILFAVQEELGARGSAVGAFGIHPDTALVTDVSFAYTPDAVRHECGVLGKGPMIGFSPVLDQGLTERLCHLAADGNIPVQSEVMAQQTGTDADRISLAGEGVRTALLSIPLRYMHTPSEVVALGDVEAVGQLMALYLMKGADPQ